MRSCIATTSQRSFPFQTPLPKQLKPIAVAALLLFVVAPVLWLSLTACASRAAGKREAVYLSRADTSSALPRQYQIAVTMEARNRLVQQIILSDLVFFQHEVDRVAAGGWQPTQEDSALIKILAYYMSAEIDLFRLYLSQPDSAGADSLNFEKDKK